MDKIEVSLVKVRCARDITLIWARCTEEIALILRRRKNEKGTTRNLPSACK